MSTLISIHDKNRAVSHISKTELVKGDATKTIPKYIKQNPQLIIALLYVDFSTYAPTKTALKYLLPLVPKGGVICFDKLNCKDWKGDLDTCYMDWFVWRPFWWIYSLLQLCYQIQDNQWLHCI